MLLVASLSRDSVKSLKRCVFYAPFQKFSKSTISNRIVVFIIFFTQRTLDTACFPQATLMTHNYEQAREILF